MFATPRKLIIASTALAAIVWFAAPAAAQRSQGTADRGRARSERPAQSAGRPQAAPVERQASPQSNRGLAAAQPPRQNVAPAVNSGARRIQAAPRQAPSTQSYRGGTPQSYRGTTSSRYNYGAQATYGVPHAYVQPRVVPYRTYNYGYGYAYGRPYGSYVYHQPVFVRPYYAYRPRFSIGFGISVGYGVAYPFQYYDPYAFYNYRIGVAPGYAPSAYSSRVGGLSFSFDPQDAAIFVDGTYVGAAYEFGADQMPLTLAVGRHHIDLRADGFRSASFDITIVGGQVIPYGGTLALN